MNNKNAKHIPIKLAPNTTISFTPVTIPITVKQVNIIVVTDVLNPSIPSVKFIALVVASITTIENGIYAHIGIVTVVFANGIIISVPAPITLIKYTIKTVATISNPNILYLGLSPSVFFNTTFLKSSINPTNPNPSTAINIGKKFLPLIVLLERLF